VTAETGWERVRRLRNHEQVLAQIQDKILDGELRIGAKLPSERELVEILGVSRTSVREALRALEAMGVIDAQAGSGRDSGSVVSGRSSEALGNLLRLHVALAEISLAELIEIRVQLEGPAAAGAAQHSTADDIARLRELNEGMRARSLPSDQFNELDAEFHVSIAKASGNALAATLMQALRAAVKSEMVAAFTLLDDWRTVADQLVDEHEGIIAAIEARDRAGASRLVEEHIRRFYEEHVARGDRAAAPGTGAG
jgi:GntR family transcriptional repressor for pyruvate dehydrogenase complex